jgi:hypothetical protein
MSSLWTLNSLLLLLVFKLKYQFTTMRRNTKTTNVQDNILVRAFESLLLEIAEGITEFLNQILSEFVLYLVRI